MSTLNWLQLCSVSVSLWYPADVASLSEVLSILWKGKKRYNGKPHDTSQNFCSHDTHHFYSVTTGKSKSCHWCGVSREGKEVFLTLDAFDTAKNNTAYQSMLKYISYINFKSGLIVDIFLFYMWENKACRCKAVQWKKLSFLKEVTGLWFSKPINM